MTLFAVLRSGERVALSPEHGETLDALTRNVQTQSLLALTGAGNVAAVTFKAASGNRLVPYHAVDTFDADEHEQL